jgi:hypothetical protein
LPHHLPLPRAVGPYTVIRTTKRIKTASNCIVFGTFQAGSNVAADYNHWTNICAVAARITDGATVGPEYNIGAGSNATSHIFDFTSLTNATTLCPSAFSVQLMNPEALQTTAGIVYEGVMHTQAVVNGRAETWNAYFDKFVQYQSPRLMSAGKLSLRGTQCSSYPLNMGEVARFTPIDVLTGDTFTWAVSQFAPSGWAPILVYNPGSVELEYLVTCEWRVRFDLDNPAAASHRHHPVASDHTWDRLMRSACALGNGVQDIAEVVANLGAAAGRVAALL